MSQIRCSEITGKEPADSPRRNTHMSARFEDAPTISMKLQVQICLEDKLKLENYETAHAGNGMSSSLKQSDASAKRYSVKA